MADDKPLPELPPEAYVGRTIKANVSSSTNRRRTLPKSPMEIFQEASSTLIEAVQKMEGELKQERRDFLRSSQEKVEAQMAQQLPPFVYVVLERQFQKSEKGTVTSILGVFATLKDANARVRNQIVKSKIDREDFKQDLDESIGLDGRMGWLWTDTKGGGLEVFIEKENVVAPGQEPVMNWGREFGAPLDWYDNHR